MLTRTKVFNILKENGLSRNSGDWKDYEMGKQLFTNGRYMDGDDYINMIRWLAEYFDV